MCYIHLRATCLSAILFFYGTTCDKQANLPQQTQSSPFILVGEQAVKLVSHCTDTYIENVEEYWTPSEADIHSLEERLPNFLSSYPSDDASLNTYIRQYTGIKKNNQHLIFINGIHPAIVNSAMDNKDLRKEALVLCGGGKMIYGLEYNKETKAFGNFTFNAAR